MFFFFLPGNGLQNNWELRIILTENRSGGKKIKDVLTFAAFIGLNADALLEDHFHLHDSNLINSMLRELKSDLCWKEGTLQEVFFFFSSSENVISTSKQTRKYYRELNLKC